jgi:hypothetical protein
LHALASAFTSYVKLTTVTMMPPFWLRSIALIYLGRLKPPQSCAHQDHFPMRDPGFLKNRSGALKAQNFIEADHWNLSMKINHLCAPPPRGGDGTLQ